MKALVFTGLRQMELRQVPEPEAPPSWSRMQVEAAGICGSDMRGYHGHDSMRSPPLIMGHEVAGRVIDGPLAGRRAIVNPMVTCGTCRHCNAGAANLCANRYAIGVQKPGGFADYVFVPPTNLFAVSEDMAPAHAALAEPAATCLRTVVIANRLSPRPLGEGGALVMGGGAIGLLCALWLKAFGVADIALAETNPLRGQTARRQGFRHVDPSADDIAADSFDVVIDAVGGGDSRALAMKAVCRGGLIVHVGLKDSDGALDMRKLTMGEIILTGSYTYSAQDLEISIRALHRGRLGTLDWVETRSLDEGPQAFQALSQGNSAAPKIVLVPSGV